MLEFSFVYEILTEEDVTTQKTSNESLKTASNYFSFQRVIDSVLLVFYSRSDILFKDHGETPKMQKRACKIFSRTLLARETLS